MMQPAGSETWICTDDHDKHHEHLDTDRHLEIDLDVVHGDDGSDHDDYDNDDYDDA